jgi:hypothetical protein
MKRFFIGLLGLLVPLASVLVTPASGQADKSAAIARILTTRALWGKDFAAGLASLPHWNSAGERAVAIFPDRIVGATPFRTAEEAQTRRGALSQALGQRRPSAAPAFTDLLRGIADRALPLRSEAAPFSDDDYYRIVLTAPGSQFLAAGLTAAQVEALLGNPESVTTQLIQNDTERRPVVLTLRSYAEGAIVFAESDWAPRPGGIDRVLIDVPAVSAVVFRLAQ